MKEPARGKSGQSLVELAISLTVIMLLLAGAVEIGLALFQYVTMRDAAQEGALYGSLEPNEVDGIKQRAMAAAQDVLRLDVGDIVVTYSDPLLPVQCEGLTGTEPHSVTVEITFSHPVTMPLIGAYIGDTVNLTARVTDTILQPPCVT
jgi:Flp pilus assembly protein TadG